MVVIEHGDGKFPTKLEFRIVTTALDHVHRHFWLQEVIVCF